MDNLFSYYTQVLFIALIVVNHLFEIYLSRRQVATLRNNRCEVPLEFKAFLSIEDHQKAIDYGSARLRFGQVKLIWGAVLLFYWFPFRGAEKLYLSIPFVNVHREVGFLIIFLFIQLLLNLPWSMYSTFVLEERFGFNRTTMKIFFVDRFKGLLLSTLIGIPLLYILFFVFDSSGSIWWLVSFIVVTAFQLFLVWIYPTLIAPLFNKFHPLETVELKERIQELVSRAGFKAREIFVMDASKRSSHGNAYFTGLGKNKRVVFFDTLLKDLELREILSILAHELGHMKLKHIPKSLITSLIISFAGFWLMGRLSNEQWFYSGHYVRAFSPGILFFIFIQALPVYTFWFSPIGSWISRKREFEADGYAAQETQAEDLVSGLLKLYQRNASPVVTDSLYSGFYHSHPPALERIKKLRSLVKGESGERMP
jgi:STE24 endopeptidase